VVGRGLVKPAGFVKTSKIKPSKAPPFYGGAGCMSVKAGGQNVNCLFQDYLSFKHGLIMFSSTD
jgi:hypothetical protein